jgi:hypothetical protein
MPVPDHQSREVVCIDSAISRAPSPAARIIRASNPDSLDIDQFAVVPARILEF